MDAENSAHIKRKRPKEKATVSTYEVLVMTKIAAQNCNVSSLTSIFAEHIYAKVKKASIHRSKNSEKKD